MQIKKCINLNQRILTLVKEGSLNILIYNLNNGETPEGVHRLERRAGSPLANPFYMRAESDRDRVCADFDDLLNGKSKSGLVLPHTAHRLLSRLEQELRLTSKLSFACWCAPRKCHTESIARLLIHRTRDMA